MVGDAFPGIDFAGCTSKFLNKPLVVLAMESLSLEIKIYSGLLSIT